MDLRSYQLEAVENALACWARGQRSTLFVCPTGGGKTLVFADLVRRHLAAGGQRVLVVADREWLIEQAFDAVSAQVDVDVGIEMNVQRVDRVSLPKVVCASIQSLIRRLSDFDPTAFDLIVIDEADLALAPSYRLVVNHFVGSKIFGCTATPERGDGLALGDLFESTCGDVDIRDLIDVGYLCAVRQYTVRVLDLSRVKMGDGDLDEASLERILTEEKHLHEVVKPTLELAGDRPTLVFGTSVRHAELLAALFNRYRPGSARSVSGKTKKAARNEIKRAFVAREFQFLCNCNLIMRGVDIPSIACVAMARPTQSRTIYVQGLGRGTRVSAGKDDLLVIDFTDGATTFSLVNAVDVLGGRATAEERERAKEIVDENPGADVSGALAQAREDLKDATVRARVLAKVKFKTREVAVHDPIDWSVQPLGSMTDSALAKKIGCSTTLVAVTRWRRGIPPFSRASTGVDWDKEPLGKVPDKELAIRHGVSQATISYHRIRRGIPLLGESEIVKHKRNNDVDWDQQPLGIKTDYELADMLGVSKSVVFRERKKRGIVPIGKRRGYVKTIDWTAQPLGEVPDEKLARELKVSPHVIRRARKRMGIESIFQIKKNERVDEYKKLPLGKVTDTEIARRIGVDKTAVGEMRRKLGIPSFKSTQSDPEKKA